MKTQQEIEGKVFNEGTSSHSSAEPFIVSVHDPWQCTTAAEIDNLGSAQGNPTPDIPAVSKDHMPSAPVYVSLFPAETEESQYTSDLIPAYSWILQTPSVSEIDGQMTDNSRPTHKEETVSYADFLLPGAEFPAHGSGSLRKNRVSLVIWSPR